MMLERRAGILLHLSSLPGRYGIGDLGEDAFRFVDFLENAGQGLWQVLPLGPTGADGCPYNCSSAFAGNPNLVSPDRLREDGLLELKDLKRVPEHDSEWIDFPEAIAYKESLLKKAFARFKSKLSNFERDFDGFQKKNSVWLEDFSFFMAAKSSQRGRAWKDWDEDLFLRRKTPLQEWKTKLADELLFHKFVQFIFFKQWRALKDYANEKNIKIVGDIPIYVVCDSADVWANRNLFTVDKKGNPTAVSGVPPDCFSRTGQLWGHPLYRWEEMEKDDFAWWRQRFAHWLELVDIARIDHFRGFESFWRIPGEASTAKTGEWVKAPGRKLFKSVKKHLGDVPIIVEDLGYITSAVEKLRDAFQFPSMKILQFAFGSAGNKCFLPHNFAPNCVVMTGGHDDDTTRAFFEKAKYKKSDAYFHAQKYLNHFGEDIVFELIRCAYASSANTAVIPMQDILNLGSAARMNTPGKRGGNWMWRFTWNRIPDSLQKKYRELAELYGRCSR